MVLTSQRVQNFSLIFKSIWSSLNTHTKRLPFVFHQVLFNVFDAFVSLGGPGINAVEIIKGVGTNWYASLIVVCTDVLTVHLTTQHKIVFRYTTSFLFRGGFRWLPSWLCLWDPDFSRDAVHQEHPDHRAWLHLHFGIPLLPHGGDALPVCHSLVSPASVTHATKP